MSQKKKTCRQGNSFYQYSEALCTQVSESHFQQVPLKFFPNFVTLFVPTPCNMREINNFMIFKKIKDLKKFFRKKPPTKFWQFIWNQSFYFCNFSILMVKWIFLKWKDFFRKKCPEFVGGFLRKRFLKSLIFFENHKVIHFPKITRYYEIKCYKVGTNVGGTC